MSRDNNIGMQSGERTLRAFCVMISLLLVMMLAALALLPTKRATPDTPTDDDLPASSDDETDESGDDGNGGGEFDENEKSYLFTMASSTLEISPDRINSKYAILCDVDTGEIIAQRGGEERIYPASMTKIMTLIVAIENIEDLDATFTFTSGIINPLYEAEASMAGFKPSDTAKLIDLLYGAALPSGADATSGLAIAVSGSERKFVELMNKKAEELGLKNTHFVNASGLHDKDHYTTPSEMATVLAYAVQNETFLKVTSARTHIINTVGNGARSFTVRSTVFDRLSHSGVRPNVEIVSGKTGYTDEAQYCLATYATSKSGHRYILVTAMGSTSNGTYGRYQPMVDLEHIYGEYVE